MASDGESADSYRAGARLFFPEVEKLVELWAAVPFLQAMGEPTLAAGAGSHGIEAYRFLWLRTRHHPIAVRVQLSPSPARLVAKVLDGKSGYDPGTLKVDIGHELTSLDVIRWSPPEQSGAGSFRAVCEYLLQLAKLGPEAEPIY